MAISFWRFIRGIYELIIDFVTLLDFSLQWIDQALRPIPANIKGHGPFGLITPPKLRPPRPLHLAERLWNVIRVTNLIRILTRRLAWEVIVRVLLLHWDFLDISEDITRGLIQLERNIRIEGAGRERTRSWYYNYANTPPLVIGTYLIVHDRFWLPSTNDWQGAEEYKRGAEEYKRTMSEEVRQKSSHRKRQTRAA